MAGFIRQINKLREVVGKDERVAAIKLQMDILYNSGVDAMADICNGDESFEIKSKSPLYTRSYLEVFGTEESNVNEIVSSVKELTKKALDLGIDAAPTPHSCYTMSRSLLRNISEESLKAGWLSYHNQESWEEEELLISGGGPLAKEYKSRGLSTPQVTGKPALLYFLDTLKSISTKPLYQNILLVHNTVTNRESIEAALDYLQNCYWAICPMSNLFIHRNLPPINLLREMGATITIGTDSLSSNTTLSIVEEIKTIHKYFPQISLNEILMWASKNGAKALSKEDTLGTFEVGKRPGIVLVDNIDWTTHKLTPESRSKRLV